MPGFPNTASKNKAGIITTIQDALVTGDTCVSPDTAEAALRATHRVPRVHTTDNCASQGQIPSQGGGQNCLAD